MGLLSQILLAWKYTSTEVLRLDRFRVFSKFCVRGRTSPFFGKALAPYELRDQLYLRTLLDFIYLLFNPFSISHQNSIESVSEKLDISTFLIYQTISHRKRIEFCRQNLWSNHLYLKHTHNVFYQIHSLKQSNFSFLSDDIAGSSKKYLTLSPDVKKYSLFPEILNSNRIYTVNQFRYAAYHMPFEISGHNKRGFLK